MKYRWISSPISLNGGRRGSRLDQESKETFHRRQPWISWFIQWALRIVYANGGIASKEIIPCLFMHTRLLWMQQRKSGRERESKKAMKKEKFLMYISHIGNLGKKMILKLPQDTLKNQSVLVYPPQLFFREQHISSLFTLSSFSSLFFSSDAPTHSYK